ncbi:MAG: AAA family ATPase [Acholeplasmatales bacterium]|nr:AAA family ATPase [Acholeplasmatales bacterium]
MKISSAVSSQKNIYNILKQANENDRLSHAYLFYGNKGTGKKELAYALACMIYNKDDTNFESETSKTILENNHMNVVYIGIMEDRKSIVKEQIISLQEEFSKTSLVEGVRIYIVDGIDTATTSAQNSLLKFIEEPVNNTPTIGIFIAQELSNVVSTIQSRCVMYHFEAIPQPVMIDILKNEGVDDLDSRLLSSLTNDSDEALVIYDDERYELVKNLFLDLLNIKKQNMAIIYYTKYLDTFYDQFNLEMLLKWVLVFLEDCCKENIESDSLIFSPLYDKIKSYRSRHEKEVRNKLELVLNLFDKLKYNITTKNIFFELMKEFI